MGDIMILSHYETLAVMASNLEQPSWVYLPSAAIIYNWLKIIIIIFCVLLYVYTAPG